MTKQEAVRAFVDRDLHPVPLDWVQTIAEAKHEEIYAWPMWGTMWFCDMPWVKHHTKPMTKENFNEDYFDEEMEGADVVVDKDGSPTNIYVYEIDGHTLIGVNGAGYDFYDGVWDKLYDILGLERHEKETN